MIKWQCISRTNNILGNPNLVTIGIDKCQSRASPRPLTSTCSCCSSLSCSNGSTDRLRDAEKDTILKLAGLEKPSARKRKRRFDDWTKSSPNHR
jgi:hypothetical protein